MNFEELQRMGGQWQPKKNIVSSWQYAVSTEFQKIISSDCSLRKKVFWN